MLYKREAELNLEVSGDPNSLSKWANVTCVQSLVTQKQ